MPRTGVNVGPYQCTHCRVQSVKEKQGHMQGTRAFTFSRVTWETGGLHIWDAGVSCWTSLPKPQTEMR